VPDSVVISAATWRLVEGYCTCESLGLQTLKGVAEPMPVYRVLGTSGVPGRVEVAARRGLTPLVGREHDVGVLLERWAQAQDGRGQVVLLSGEAGIGKSRLLHVLDAHLAGTPHTRLVCRSSPYHHDSALYPLIDLLHRALHAQTSDGTQASHLALAQLLETYHLATADTVPLLARLLAIPVPDGAYPPLTGSPQQQRQQTLEVLRDLVLAQAARQPVLFMLEDLHWTDPSTLEWLTLLLAQVPTVPILTLLTCRPEFQIPWGSRSYLTPLVLQRFTRAQVETMVLRMTGGKPLPAAVLQHLVEKSDGVPLYVEEMTKAILEAGVLQETEEHYALTGPLTALTIPSTLQDALMARLDRLGPAKSVAQLGATLGRQFAYALLQAVAQMDEGTLQETLIQLVDAELLYQRGAPPQATYTFKHALIQDTAYQALLKSTRQQYHQRIAQVLEARFPEVIEEQPEVLGHHYTEAGMYEPAAASWQRAGQRAVAQSANAEAIRHLTRGLEVLALLPETIQRAHQELDLQIALGRAVMAAKGFAAPELERIHFRARDLCHQLGDPARLFPVLYGLWRLYTVTSQLDTARETGEQLLSLAQRLNDPALLVGSHTALGVTYGFLGEIPRSREHLERGIRLYDQHACDSSQFAQEPDPKITCLIWLAMNLVILGYPEQAVQCITQCLTLTHKHNRPFGRVYALTYASYCYEARREAQRVQELAEQAISLAQEHGFTQWLASSSVMRGWACAMQGQMDEGKAAIEEGLTAYATGRLSAGRSRVLVLFAEVCGMAGFPDEGLRALAEAQTIPGTRSYDAELYRLKGELLLHAERGMRHAESTPEDCFQKALNIARAQQAKWWELRAATSLARLWQQQGKRQDAYDLLAPVYNWFTEGFDTADLQKAKALLETLNMSHSPLGPDQEDTSHDHND
jgi:tetratricopeptide (TPR) repeat protein